MKNKYKISIFALAALVICYIVLVVISCKPQPPVEESGETIFAKVGDKTISLNEFIRRAEYTIRPRYCRGNGNLDKKIIANSLIAEKMFAIEAGNENNLAQSEHFQRFIEGRKQQAMRQWLYHVEGIQKVKIDEDEIRGRYELAGRKYRVHYFGVPNDTAALMVKEVLEGNPDLFDTLYFEISDTDSLPTRQVDYYDRQSEIIHQALFSKKYQVGDIVGPLSVGDGSHITLRIEGWTDERVISESAVSRRWEDVKEDLQNEKARKIYEEFIAGVMRGKSMDFHRDTFNRIVQILAPVYITDKDEEQQRFLNMVFNRNVEQDSTGLVTRIEEIENDPLFEVDGNVWLVKDFLEELERHPLVFRKQVRPDVDFAHQFRLAVVDMIQDKYLTEEAYRRGYDTVDVVKRNTEMWRDASIALYYRAKILQNTGAEGTTTRREIQKYLNPYVDSLQQKYSDVIEINVQAFDTLKLTDADMFVTQANVPFPTVVPAFPQITTDHWLDYGHPMETR